MTAGATGTTQDRRWETLLASVWLVFLIFPAVAMLTSGASVQARVLWVAGVAVFVAAYLGAILEVLARWKRPAWQIVGVHTAAMLVGAALMVPAGGSSVLYLGAYFVALWLYGAGSGRDARPGVAGAVTVVVAGTVLGFVWAPQVWLYLLLPLWLSSALITVIWAAERRSTALREVEELTAASRQRESIARDLHDVLGHSLTVVTLKVELARRLVDVDPARTGAELDEVLALTRRSLADVRATVGGLRTPDLAGQLAAARTALAAAGVTAHLPGPEAVAGVEPSHRETLAWCLREAVTNVVRHAEAEHCTVALGPGFLTVEDDGCGIGQAADEGDGSGLAGMRARVAAAGGTLTVGSAASGGRTLDPPGGRGTRVEVRW